MKILLTGAHGQIGREIMDLAQQLKFNVYAYNHQQLDITQIEEIKFRLAEIKPNYIINAAAYTAVDTAETDQERAFAVNAFAVKNLANMAREFDIPLLHISTDYVFDGKKNTAYVEEDVAQPLSVYGLSKLAGENFLKEIWHKHIILRVSWVFGVYGNNFVKAIVHRAKKQSELRVVSDQRGAPTYAGDIALTLLKIIEHLDKGQTDWGIYHYTGTPITNWYEFAQQIVDKAKIPHKLVLKDIFPILTVEYPSIATRPYHSELICDKIANIFNIRLSNWDQGLIKVVSNLS